MMYMFMTNFETSAKQVSWRNKPNDLAQVFSYANFITLQYLFIMVISRRIHSEQEEYLRAGSDLFAFIKRQRQMAQIYIYIYVCFGRIHIKQRRKFFSFQRMFNHFNQFFHPQRRKEERIVRKYNFLGIRIPQHENLQQKIE